MSWQLDPQPEWQANAEAEDYQSVVKEDEEQEEGEDQDMWSVGVPEEEGGAPESGPQVTEKKEQQVPEKE